MFSKKKKGYTGLPDLPPVQTPMGNDFGEDDFDESLESHALPSFPNTHGGNNFSQVAIKDAVNEDESSVPDFSDNEREVKIVEMDEWKPGHSVDPMEEHYGEPAPLPMRTSVPPQIREPESRILPPPEPVRLSSGKPSNDVFVKLDKFHTARRALRDVREKLEGVDEMIKRVREIKLREEQEIASWEKDLMHAKTRIQEVNENIFEKIE